MMWLSLLRQILSSISLLYYPLHDEIEKVKIIKCDKDVIFTYHSSSRKEPLDGVILFKKKEEEKKNPLEDQISFGCLVQLQGLANIQKPNLA